MMRIVGYCFFVLLSGYAAIDDACADMAYITNQNSSDISVVDLDRGEEIKRIAVPGKPAGIAVSSQLGIVITVSPDDKTIRKFDLKSNALIGELELEGGPIGIAIYGQRAYVSDWYNARIWIVDCLDMRVEGELETGAAPAGLAISSDGAYLASADRDADQVSIFTLKNHQMLRQIKVGIRPFGLAFDHMDRLFVANVGSNDVHILTPETGKILSHRQVGERPYGIAFAKNKAFISNQYEDTVSVLSLIDFSAIATIAVGEYPEGIFSTGDQSKVVVANWFANSLSVIDSKALEVMTEIEVGDGPRAFGNFILND